MYAKGPLTIPNIFTLAFRERCMTKLKDVPVPKQGKRTPTAAAAVLVPLCRIDNVPSLLYTMRSTKIKTDGGQISFPGGKVDKDESPIQAALRETEEEIGLSPTKIDIWGQGPTFPGRSERIMITPVIGAILELTHKDFKINHKEVQEVFAVPLDLLCDPKNQYYTQFQNGFILPVFTAEDHKIWGLTAYITHILLSSLLSKDYYRNDWMKKKIVLQELEH